MPFAAEYVIDDMGGVSLAVIYGELVKLIPVIVAVVPCAGNMPVALMVEINYYFLVDSVSPGHDPTCSPSD
jgi:hypothetical protein